MIQSPYQQNIDLLKAFFKKPIVLVLSILSFLSIALGILYSFLSPYDDVINYLVKYYYSSLGVYADTAAQPTFPIFSIDIIGILFGVAFLLFYLYSKKPEGNLSAPSMILKVISIIEIITSSIACAALLLLTAFLGFIFSFNSNLDNKLQTLLTICFGFFVALSLFSIISIIYYISQLLFANSIRKGITSIYLKRSGAMLFGIFNFIFALTTAASNIAILLFFLSFSGVVFINPIAIVLTIVETVVMVAFKVVTGIVAIKYSLYIKNVSQKFVIENNQQEINPAESFTPDTAAYNNPVQPAPFVTNTPSNNPYEQVPNYAPQAEVPQAPVREDFAQQPTVAEEVTPYYPEQPQPAPVEEAPVEEEAPVTEYVRNKPVEQNIENPAPRYCIECGRPINPGDNFCNNCGTEVNYK